MPLKKTQIDVVVVGAGLAGLTAALDLQQANFKVLLIEKNAVPGGLCGTFNLNGYEFVIGCNDFCYKVVDILKSLKVSVPFKPARTRLYFEDNLLQFPPTFKTVFKMLTWIPDIIRLMRVIKLPQVKNMSLEEFTSIYLSNKLFIEFIRSFSSPNGATPKDYALQQLLAEFSKTFQYQHNKTMTPTGGPGVIIDKMVRRFVETGGQLMLNTHCLSISKKGNIQKITTNMGEVYARYVVTSQGRYDQYPTFYKKGLAISKLLFAVKSDLIFPKGIHTIAYFPPNISQWLLQIDKGKMPEQFGFHFFPHHSKGQPKYYTLNVYCYLPRQLDEPNEALLRSIKFFIINKIEKFVPGFQHDILYQHWISPKEFINLHGISSQVSPMAELNFQKPDGYDLSKDIYYIGNSVYPTGNHAGAAMSSAMMASTAIKAR